VVTSGRKLLLVPTAEAESPLLPPRMG